MDRILILSQFFQQRAAWIKIVGAKRTGMNHKQNKSSKSSIALVGFVAGVLTVVLVVFALKGC